MNIIFYWKKSYFKKEHLVTLRDFEFYTSYPPLGISKGDTMWIIIKNEDSYVLAGKFIIKQTMTKQNIHGHFCILGDKNVSIFYKFDDVNKKKFKSFIQGLYNWSNDEIGAYFRGKKHIHELTDFAHQEFEKFSKILQTN